MNLSSVYNIKKINYRVENFRSLEDIEINLKPITLLFGANGSGKSTLIKSILFLKHYLNHVYNPDQAINPYWYLNEHALTGSEIDLVSFADTVTNNDIGREIKIGFKIEAHKTNSQKEVEELLTSEEVNEINPTHRRNGSLAVPDHLNFETSFYFSDNRNESFLLKRIEIFDILDDVTISYLPYLTTNKENSNLHLDIEVSGNKDYIKDLKILFSEISEVPLFGNSSYRRDNSRIDDMIVRILEQTKNINSKNVDKYYEILGKFTIYLPSLVMDILKSSYVPSIRELPKKSYILNNQRFSIFDYYGIARLLDENTDFKKNINTLIKEHFDKTEQIKIKKDTLAGQLIVENSRSKSQVNLLNSSSGFLQLLPIMSNLLESSETINSMFLCEQPELHLHPKLQTKLVDLFIDKKFRETQKIIETHSEHIIRKIQVLVAQEKISKDDVAVYYFDKNEEGITAIKELLMDDNGFFKDPWPGGFFDEASDLAFELIDAQINRKN